MKRVVPPNGSRLSCGRNGRGRKAVRRQKKRLGGEATQFFLTYDPPGSFKRMLGRALSGATAGPFHPHHLGNGINETRTGLTRVVLRTGAGQSQREFEI